MITSLRLVMPPKMKNSAKTNTSRPGACTPRSSTPAAGSVEGVAGVKAMGHPLYDGRRRRLSPRHRRQPRPAAIHHVAWRGALAFAGRRTLVFATPTAKDRHMRYDISGTVMQTVSIDLMRGETVYAQTHAMAWMTDGIVMDTHTGGGLFAGLKRAMSGGSLFITEYSAESARNVAFAPRFPCQILAV